MGLPVYRLRRWLVVIAVLFITVIAGMYLYARLRQLSVLKAFPGKIGIDIKQTANGFQFSKSEAGRTVFSIRAKSVKEFKLNGHAELHDVSIVLYGRDTSRFDQIYGDEFTYDQKSGDVTARGDVQIDLEANPSGVSSPDQATPKELKNPIHLKTSNLIFNQNSGNASTDARVDFSTPQASGWAVGVQYTAKSNTLTLSSQIHVTLSGEHAASLFASHGRITREPREVVLDNSRLDRQGGTLQAAQATFFLTADNQVERVLASGNVNATSAAGVADQTRARADEAELLLTGKQNLLSTATLTGNVHAERGGSQPMQGDAGRAVLDFRGQNQLQKVHASDGVRLAQHAANAGQSAVDGSKARAAAVEGSTPQDFDLKAPIVDFFIADGRRLSRAETSGAAQITISPAQNSTPASTQASGQRTVITAGRFDAKFAPTPEGKSQLTSIHGAPNAKIVNVAAGVPDRVSTSQILDAAFLPEGGIASIVQQGNVAYSDGMPPEKRTQAWADRARYTPADRILVLAGNPRVSDGGMVTTARTIRINRATDDAIAEGDVKSTYNELKEQPDGALLASASPIHVTAATMTAHNSPAVALYQGNARLWQDANLIEAPSIEFDRDRRSLVAQGTVAQPVLTTLVQGKAGQTLAPRSGKRQSNPGSHEKADESSPIALSAARLSYSDPERRAHYDGGVTAHGTGFTATSTEMDVYLLPRSQASSNQSLTSPGRLDHMVAQGKVVIDQPGRRAEGNTLVYTAADDKFVLTGGPPSIFDAERGKITGVSLTFFRHDDRVLVEGEANTPVVTQTRVAR
ncbi:MAG TPA: LPS export ABC transporter periplasmic protein LptC [Candidatus Dormibacteraeota bacterium]|nr:LPS export ABC transporter periplasmic protein LptC [Candidatus Dormibacteraeota bacterium]